MYWEYEITDRQFDELMFYMDAKEAVGIRVKMNCPKEDGVITINTLFEYFDYNDHTENIREWIASHHPLQSAEFNRKYPKGKEWKW
ncbi:MAG TPA: hypothetical protein PLM98_16195 [Thiolinea sp.]|nr:hypothetical protein [Thiolinea sp.]